MTTNIATRSAFTVGFIVLAGLAPPQSSAQEIKLKPGVIAGKVAHEAKARNYAYCEIALAFGKPPQEVFQFYNTTGTATGCPADKFAGMDAKKVAAATGADAVYLNPTPQTARRYWVMDQAYLYEAGETVDFFGVDATWGATMKPEAVKAATTRDFEPAVIHRKTVWFYAKGSTVFLLRTRDKKTFVMQSYATEVDPSQSYDQLPQLGSKLKLPAGWKYEVKTLSQDLTIDPRRVPGNAAHITQDDLHNRYEGCGFDKACNYVP